MSNPSSPSDIVVSWEAIATACGVLTFLGGLATAYLRLFMSKALHEMRDSLLVEMKTNFVFKEAHRPEMHSIKKEIARNEADIHRATDRIDELDLRLTRKIPK